LGLIGKMRKENSKREISPSLDLDTALGLKNFLCNRSIDVENFVLLQGGYTSTVFKAENGDQTLIIKHSRPRDSFYPIRRKMKDTRAITEFEILKKLHPLFPQQVPAIHAFFPDESVTVMSDVGQDAQLGINYFLDGRAELKHACALGKFLGELKEATAEWEPFKTVEQPFEQVWTRGIEVDTASEEWGQRMRDYYLNSTPGFVWPDGHPKNVFFGNAEPLIRVIDFDCSHFADQDYMLPNFLGQIPVFTAMGHISPDQGIAFTKDMIESYNKISLITPEIERKMVFYAATQIIQRQDGKWLFDVCGGNNDEKSLLRKAFLFYLGRRILTSAETFDQYLDMFQKELHAWLDK